MLDLDAIEAAEKAMTPGPIAVYEDRVRCYLHGPEQDGGPAGPDGEWLADVACKADAVGFALLRNAAPEMIRRIREQEAEIERLRALCGEAAETHSLMLEHAGATNLQDDHYDRLWAASKGEQ